MSSSLTVCPYFFNCPFIKDPTHINSYLHLCKYGQSCRDLNNSQHTSHFYHLSKPLCTTRHDHFDMNHFLEYHHPGLPDFLTPCKHGPSCLDRNNFDHASRYQHEEPPRYPNIPFAIPPPSILPQQYQLSYNPHNPTNAAPQQGFGFDMSQQPQQQQQQQGGNNNNPGLYPKMSTIQPNMAPRTPPKMVCRDPCCPDCNDINHVWSYKHMCPYGASCKFLSNQRHMALFVHANIPTCPKGATCGGLCDAEHRSSNHHPGYWDFLVPCPWDDSCIYLNDKEHCRKYQHGRPPVYGNLFNNY